MPASRNPELPVRWARILVRNWSVRQASGVFRLIHRARHRKMEYAMPQDFEMSLASTGIHQKMRYMLHSTGVISYTLYGLTFIQKNRTPIFLPKRYSD